MKKLYSIYHMIIVALVLAFSMPVFASDVSWHQKSRSYTAYLGVVPASLLKKKLHLIDGDRKLHGSVDVQGSSSQHVMVALFENGTNKRVKDATIIAKVSRKRLLGKQTVVRPMEKMLTSGKVTYGNFFRMQKGVVYRIDLMVYRTNGNGVEKIRLHYKRP